MCSNSGESSHLSSEKSQSVENSSSSSSRQPGFGVAQLYLYIDYDRFDREGQLNRKREIAHNLSQENIREKAPHCASELK